MNYKKILVAYNSKSGRFSKSKLSIIFIFLNSRHIEYVEFDITIKKLDKNFAESFDAVMVAGGDGTLNSVINNLAFSDVPIAHIPMGTVNLFALENKTPFKIQKALSEILDRYTPLKINLGKANEKYFIEMAGIGIDAFIVKYVESSLSNRKPKKPLKKIDSLNKCRNLKKYLFYIINIFKLSGKIDFKNKLVIEIEGKRYFANQIIASNIKYYGGPFKFFRDNSLWSRNFHIRIINAENLLDLIIILIKSFIFSNQYQCKNSRYVETDKIKIFLKDSNHFCNKNLYLQLDGEFQGETSEIEIEKAESAVVMLINPDLIRNIF